MNKVWMTSLATMAAAAVFAQTPVVLYAPVKLIKDQGITLKSWGSGTAGETDELAYEGSHSIRISTRNNFAGGLVLFGTPINVSDRFADNANMLRIVYRAADSSTVMGGGAPGKAGGGPGFGGAGGGGKAGGGAGAAGGNQGAGEGSGAAAGGPGRAGGGQGAGGRGGGLGSPGGLGGGTTSTAPKFQTMRVIVSTSDGLKSEAYVPVTTSGSGNNGWKSVAIPLSAISGFGRTNKQISGMAFAGDATTTFYIGDLRVVNDTTPITGDANVQDLNLALGDSVIFSANGYGGSSILKYSWDFDAKDGIQEDAVGQSIKRQFRKPGTFTITLTITDVYGLKRPYTTTIKAKVNP